MTPQRTPSAEERFTELFDATHARVLGYALRRVSTPEDAADVLAETYLIAWRRVDDLPPGSAGLPWLLATARRVMANHRRGQARRTALADRLRGNWPTPRQGAHQRPSRTSTRR